MNLLTFVWTLFVFLFMDTTNIVPLTDCKPGAPINSATCSFSGYELPGYPTPETWTRQIDTPNIFYGRAVPYGKNIMEATALKRGFDQKYLDEFDCLASGFFVNDVGRTAWILHRGYTYKCLIVDNAYAKDLYNTVIMNREVIEVSYQFAKDVLEHGNDNDINPTVVVAYQDKAPNTEEWQTAQRLDLWLYKNWRTGDIEPTGFVHVSNPKRITYRVSNGGWKSIYIGSWIDKVNEDGFKDYIVKSGDSLSYIATFFYGRSGMKEWNIILEANPQAKYLQEGMQLKIPIIQGDWDIHEITLRDTLEIIAIRYYGSDEDNYVQMIYEANKDTLIDPNLIQLGTLLKIPLLE